MSPYFFFSRWDILFQIAVFFFNSLPCKSPTSFIHPIISIMYSKNLVLPRSTKSNKPKKNVIKSILILSMKYYWISRSVSD